MMRMMLIVDDGRRCSWFCCDTPNLPIGTCQIHDLASPCKGVKSILGHRRRRRLVLHILLPQQPMLSTTRAVTAAIQSKDLILNNFSVNSAFDELPPGSTRDVPHSCGCHKISMLNWFANASQVRHILPVGCLTLFKWGPNAIMEVLSTARFPG